jgi:hypothetical protein
MFIGLIEFARPFRALNKQQLIDLFVEGRSFTRAKRLPIAENPPILLHDAHHAFAEKLASSGTRPFSSYRFIPATPQKLKQVVKKYKQEPGYWEHRKEQGGIVVESDLGEKNKVIRKKNKATEEFIAGLEGIKIGGDISLDAVEDSRSYWLGRRTRKKLLPKEYKNASYMVRDPNTGQNRPTLVREVEEAFEESRRVPLPSPTSSRYYYRKRFGKVEKVRKGDR